MPVDFRVKGKTRVPGATGSPAARTPAVRGGFVDPRLRGLDLGGPPAGQLTGYDLAARQYAVMRGDPYEHIVRKEIEIGRRMPAPYSAPSALAGRLPTIESAYTPGLAPEHAVYPSAAIAGHRQTQSGTVGSEWKRIDEAQWFDARKRFGYGEMQSRGAGYSQEWDTAENRERKAGRLDFLTKFSQEVDPRYPYLHLRAGGTAVTAQGTFDGNALMEVSGGLSEGGASMSRRFLIGGGLVASFNLDGWNTATIEIIGLLAGTFVEFAWVTKAVESTDRSLLLPEHYTTAGLAAKTPVPEGAFAVIMENPTPAVAGTTVTVEWGANLLGAPFTFTQTINDYSSLAPPAPQSAVSFGTPAPVLAPIFAIDTTVDIVWLIRPI